MDVVLTRFEHHLSKNPYCLTKLGAGLLVRPALIAIKYPYIQINGRLKRYFVFDIDKSGAAFSYEDASLPPPTITIINPINSHAHLLYELEYPVLFPKNDNETKVNTKPTRLYNALYWGMAKKLESDTCYTGLICKNPLHKKWNLIIHDVLYSLNELCDYVNPIYNKKIPNRSRELKINTDEIVHKGQRHNFLFDLLRQHAYEIVHKFEMKDDLYESLFKFLNMVNNNACDPPMRDNEIKSLCRSVSFWTWKRRNGIKVDNKNRGVMELPPISECSPDEFKSRVKERQSYGAKYTNRTRRDISFTKITNAITNLKSLNLKITKTAISKITGISRQYITREYSYLLEETND